MQQTHLEELLNEVRLLYQSMMQIGEGIHADSRISMGMRAVLEYLSREGDATVPQMARARRVTRQRMQTLVNALLDLDLVSRRDNPESRRSHLIAVTEKGRETIDDMRRREGEFFPSTIADAEIRRTVKVLREVRDSMEHAFEARRI
jgi:DNA-binding MarR family transcriptional regulator